MSAFFMNDCFMDQSRHTDKCLSELSSTMELLALLHHNRMASSCNVQRILAHLSVKHFYSQLFHNSYYYTRRLKRKTVVAGQTGTEQGGNNQ